MTNDTDVTEVMVMKIELETAFLKRVFKVLAALNNEAGIEKVNGELHFYAMNASGATFYDANAPFDGEFLGTMYVDPREVLNCFKHKEKSMTLSFDEGRMLVGAGKKVWTLPTLLPDGVKSTRRIRTSNVPADTSVVVDDSFLNAIGAIGTLGNATMTYDDGSLTISASDGIRKFSEKLTVSGNGPAVTSHYSPELILEVADGVTHIAYKADYPLILSGEDFVAIVASVVAND